MIYRIVILLSLVVAVIASGARHPSTAKVRSAKKILAAIKLVDGSGSGLDADTVRGGRPPVVIDSSGVEIGPVFTATMLPTGAEAAYVIRHVDETPVLFPVQQSRFGGYEGNEVLMFESTDCSGTPLVQPKMFFPAVLFVFGSTGYYATDSTVTRPLASQRSHCAPEPCCEPFDHPTDPLPMAVAAQVDIGALGFTPPFRIDVP